MNETNNKINESEMVDKFVLNRGYSINSLRLIALVYRTKCQLDHFNNIQIILNYQEQSLVIQNNKLSETFQTESLCFTSLKYNGEILGIIGKSIPDARFIQCYLIRFRTYSDVFQITTFVNMQSRHTKTIPHYSSILFEKNHIISDPLNYIMRNHEVDEVKILHVKSISPQQYQSENFPKTLMYDETNGAKSRNIDIEDSSYFDIYSFNNNHIDVTIIEPDSCYCQSLVTSTRIFLIIITAISIQFLDTQLKRISAEIYLIDLKEIVRQTDQQNRVLIIFRNHLNYLQCSLESLHIQFTEENNCKRFVDSLCIKGEIQYRSLKLCSNCPRNIINQFSNELHDESNKFQFDEPDKIENVWPVMRVQKIINSYLEKIEDSNIDKSPNETFGTKVLSVFDRVLKYYEEQQSNHNCFIQTKDKLPSKVSSKLWENVKNLFNKKLSMENKSHQSIEGYGFVMKNEKSIEEKDTFPISDDNGLLLRSLSSRTRRAISVNEPILQRLSVAAMNQEYFYRPSNYSDVSNEIYSSINKSRKNGKLSFKSVVFVVVASLRLTKTKNRNWNFTHKVGVTDIKNYPINLTDIKKHFGPKKSLSYSLNTINKKSFTYVDHEWDIILKSNNGKGCRQKIIESGVSWFQRRDAWKLLMRTSLHLKSDKIYKYQLNPVFEKVLEQMINTDIFDCNLAKEFYKKSFTEMNRSNTDILNDIGRTMPQLSYFAKHFQGQLDMYNVLRAYALLDPEVSYCQGMNFIVSIFLLYMNDEEAFISLIFYMIFLERREIYLPSMIGIKHSFYKLERLVTDFCPALNFHLLDKNFPISLYASSWIMTLFSTSYPLHFVIKVFDMLLTRGTSIVFNVSITLIGYVADQVLQLMEFDSIYEQFCKTLNNLSDEDLTHILHKASEINITRNLEIYDLEITCNMKNNVADNDFVQRLCVEITDLRLENLIFRRNIEAMQKEVIELKRTLINLSKNDLN